MFLSIKKNDQQDVLSSDSSSYNEFKSKKKILIKIIAVLKNIATLFRIRSERWFLGFMLNRLFINSALKKQLLLKRLAF